MKNPLTNRHAKPNWMLRGEKLTKNEPPNEESPDEQSPDEEIVKSCVNAHVIETWFVLFLYGLLLISLIGDHSKWVVVNFGFISTFILLPIMTIRIVLYVIRRAETRPARIVFSIFFALPIVLIGFEVGGLLIFVIWPLLFLYFQRSSKVWLKEQGVQVGLLLFSNKHAIYINAEESIEESK